MATLTPETLSKPVHTNKGAPLSAPLRAIVNACIALGLETKSLALGVRIIGTDAVASDVWCGLYLCKSGGRGLQRAEHNGAMLTPADKGQWCARVASCATDETMAMAQAHAIVAMAVRAGYVGLGIVADTLAPFASVDSADTMPSVVDTSGDSDKPRRKRAKGADKASVDGSALDKALAVVNSD